MTSKGPITIEFMPWHWVTFHHWTWRSWSVWSLTWTAHYQAAVTRHAGIDLGNLAYTSACESTPTLAHSDDRWHATWLISFAMFLGDILRVMSIRHHLIATTAQERVWLREAKKTNNCLHPLARGLRYIKLDLLLSADWVLTRALKDNVFGIYMMHESLQ
jgi:hypothetical protein